MRKVSVSSKSRLFGLKPVSFKIVATPTKNSFERNSTAEILTANRKSGKPEKAIEIYRELLANFPNWVNAHYDLGHALMTAGRHAEAVEAFRRTLELQPGLNVAHLHLATCLQRIGRNKEAARELEIYRAAQPALAAKRARVQE